MKRILSLLFGVFIMLGTITACAESGNDMYTVNTKIADVIANPVFGDYGRLIFPVNTGYYSGDTLGNLHLTMPVSEF